MVVGDEDHAVVEEVAMIVRISLSLSLERENEEQIKICCALYKWALEIISRESVLHEDLYTQFQDYLEILDGRQFKIRDRSKYGVVEKRRSHGWRCQSSTKFETSYIDSTYLL